MLTLFMALFGAFAGCNRRRSHTAPRRVPGPTKALPALGLVFATLAAILGFAGAAQAASPVLGMTIAHSGSATQGQWFTFQITPRATAADTSGPVVMDVTLPAEMLLVNIVYNTGESCTAYPHYLTCTSSDVIHSGGSGLSTQIQVIVDSGASSPLSISGTVSGGGAASSANSNTDIVIVDQAANHFSVSAPSSATTGTAFNTLTVTALDGANAIVTGYSGTVHFTSTDGSAVLPGDARLSGGTGTFTATLNTPGARTITATDTTTAITGRSGSITVSAPTPTVTGIGPSSGPSTGGTTVTITGANLTGASAVSFGATAATGYTVNSATSITATAPAGTGTVDIRVTTIGGTTATSSSDQFTYVSAPTLTGISPSSGPSTGGTTVTITGANLTGASAVTFGATAATSFTVNSATSISATAPAGTGTVDIRVTTTGGTTATSSSDQFTYVASPTMTGISPSSGPSTGGTTVTITGASLTGATAVTFGVTAATSFTVNSATSITATAPAGTGTVDIRVTTTGGTTATSSADQFTYVGAPAVTSISLSSGSAAGGDAVVITGTGFTGATAVKFGATDAAHFTVDSATRITASAPAGTGVQDITVTTAGGTSATSSADRFTYAILPVAGATAATVNFNSANNAVALALSGGAATSVAVSSPPSHGTATVSGLAISYTPATGYSGADSFTYTASNAGGTSAAAAASITVSNPPLSAVQAVRSTTLTEGVAAAAFTPVTATGGNGTLSYTLSGGALPAGLSFAGATGEVSGTPTAVLAPTTFTVTVTDQTTPTAQTSSRTFSLTVNAMPDIVTDPADISVMAGATATFTAAAGGSPVPTVQWQISTDKGASFSDISGATTATYSFVTSAAQTGARFRAVFTNVTGTATTTAATLTVTSPITVSANPTDVTVYEGQMASFTVAATGSPAPTVQWQRKAATATVFVDVAGATSTTLSFQTVLADTGSLYRAVFSNGAGTVTTTAAKLTVQARPDPTKDAEVIGVITAESQAALRFADQQMSTFDERLTRLHGDGFAGSASQLHMGFGFGDDRSEAAIRRRADLQSRGELYAAKPAQAGADTTATSAGATDAGRTQAGANSALGVWLGGALTFGHRDPNTQRAAFKFQSTGTSLGADLRINDKLSIGAGIGVNNDTARLGDLGTRVTSQATIGVIYGTVRPGHKAYVDVILATGTLNFDSHRALTGLDGQFADGARKGTEAFASLKAGWDWTNGRSDTISPYGRLTLVDGRLGAFSETSGGSLALSYQTQSVGSLTMAFGGRASRAYPFGYGVWTPNVLLEYAHEFRNAGTARVAYTDWIGSPVYTIPTDPYFHDRIVTGFGTELNAGGLNLSVDYRHNFDSGAASSDTLETHLKLQF